MPDNSTDMLEVYIKGINPLADFLIDSCEFHQTEFRIGKDELFAGYRLWAERRGIERPKGRSEFYRLLASSKNVNTVCRCDPETGTTRAADGSIPPRHVHGMRLKRLGRDADWKCSACGASSRHFCCEIR
jgi:hypothetical protein